MADRKHPDETQDSKPELADAPDVQESTTADAPDIVDAELLPDETPEAFADEAEDEAPEDTGEDKADTDDALTDANAAEEIMRPDPIIERVVEKRGSVLPGLIGGVLAASIGFIAARSEVLDPILPAAFRSNSNAEMVTDLRAQLDAQNNQISGLADKLAGIEIPDLAPLRAQLSEQQSAISDAGTARDALSGRIDTVQTTANASIGALQSRLQTLEKRPMAENVSEDAIAAYENELAALQASIAEQRAQIEAKLEEARAAEEQARALEKQSEAQAEAARLQAILGQARQVAASGAPFATAVSEIEAAGISLPGAVTSAAQTGLPSLPALSDAFPDAARAALKAARAADPGEGGIGNYLRRQLGARSVTPREGSDPDAVLSRAEAAVLSGDLTQAISEISTLPDDAQAALSDWTNLAQSRLNTLAEFDRFIAGLNTN